MVILHLLEVELFFKKNIPANDDDDDDDESTVYHPKYFFS